MLRLEIPDSSGQEQSKIDAAFFQNWGKLSSMFTLCQTALHVASEYGKANSMAALLEWGADVDAQETG